MIFYIKINMHVIDTSNGNDTNLGGMSIELGSQEEMGDMYRKLTALARAPNQGQQAITTSREEL